MDESPIFGISLEDYHRALSKAHATSHDAPGVAEAAAALGLDAKKWKFAAPKWAERIASRPKTKTELAEEETARQAAAEEAADAKRAARKARRGGGEASKPLEPYVEPSRDLEALIDLTVRLYRGEDPEKTYARHNLDKAGFDRLRGEWEQAFPHRMRDYMRYGLIAQRASQVTDEEKLRRKKGPAMATRVRARRCSWCGAHKRTVHSRPWIHCDSCGALFDYDLNARTAAQSNMTDYGRSTLDEFLAKEKKPQDPGERAKYDLEAQRWIHDVLVEVTPWDYPARIGDKAYRDRYLDHWLLPAEKTLRESAEYQASWRNLVIADRNLPQGKQPFLVVLRYYDMTQSHLDIQVKLLGDAGLFEKHPDKMTAELYRRSRISVFVEGWVGSMKAEEAEKLIAHSNMRDEFIDPPAVAAANAGCGKCGSMLVIIASATRVVCDDCGAMADAKKIYSCRACGGPLIAEEGKVPDECGSCGVRWETVLSS